MLLCCKPSFLFFLEKRSFLLYTHKKNQEGEKPFKIIHEKYVRLLVKKNGIQHY